jgi:xanthine/uracil permease
MILHSGVVTATASALLLNVFFNVLGFGGGGSVPAQDEPADRR